MAHSTWMIPPSHEKTANAKHTSGKRSINSTSRAQASFAAMMADEQNRINRSNSPENRLTAQDGAERAGTKYNADTGGASEEQKKPLVATLPEAGTVFNNALASGRASTDMSRFQNFRKARIDMQRTRALSEMLQNAGSTSLDIARGMNAAKNMRTIAAAGNGKGFALTANDYIHTSRPAANTRTTRVKKSRELQESGIGSLSAKFESGGAGISAIGYDRAGGTSYGKYQIASRVGSMKNFLSYLDGEAPDLAKRLRSAGPANTGSRSGRMPDEWRAIAKECPERFERLQESFIRESHYKPALAAIEQSTGIDSSSLSTAMREVIWSTAVQHGPAGAARIFARADNMSGKASDAAYERNLIKNVYTVRAGQFGSSTDQVRNAVRNRFREERQIALNMLDGAGRANMA